jgi:outer membrane receptor protein involved in Fe transport
MATPTPVTAVTIDELNALDPGATITAQLDLLPQFFGSTTAAAGGLALSGTAGASFLNMRGIGTNRTLTLLDGARMAPADKRGSVNADTLPTALIRSTDIVTGGASAAYGADAMGGVTNFVLDREFQGLRISGGTGINEFGDGFRWNSSFAGGKRFLDGRLSLIGSFETRYNEQFERQYDDMSPSWYQRWNYVTNPAWLAGGCTVNVYCEAGPQRILAPHVVSVTEFPYGMIQMPRVPALNRLVFNREGTAVEPISNLYGEYSTDATMGLPAGNSNNTSGGRLFEILKNASPGAGSSAEVVGRNSFASAKWDFTENFSVWGQLVHGVSESNNKPTRPDTGGISLSSTWAPLIAVDNAYLPEYVRNIMIENNLSEITVSRGGGALTGIRDIGANMYERNIFTSNTWSVGFTYDLPRDWRWTGSYSTGKTERKSMVYENTRVDRMFLAMDAVRDPETGKIVCRVQLPQYRPTVEQLRQAGLDSGLLNSPSPSFPNPGPLGSPIGLDNSINECVPFNVMGAGNISEDAIDYIGTDKMGLGIVTQDFAETLLTGNLWEGWGYGPVAAAFGLTWRESGFVDAAYPEDIDLLGPPRNVPALGIRGIPGGYTDGGPNLHKFSTVPYVYGDFNVWEWFTEVNTPIWQASNGVQRFDGSVAFRQSDYNLSGRSNSWKIGLEATLIEGLRFRATRSTDVREASFAERFDEQAGGGGVRDRFNDDVNVSISIIARGNPEVGAETARTNVAGLVWQPPWDWADGLSFSLDWYDINIYDEIQQISAQDVMDFCFEGDLEQCDNIIRDEEGTIGTIIRKYFNLARSRTEGSDFEVSYRFDPDFFADHRENLNLRILGGYQLARGDYSDAGVLLDRTGGTAPVDLTWNGSFGYTFDSWSMNLNARYSGPGKRNLNYVNGIQADLNDQPSYTLWSGSVGYRGELQSGATWSFSVQAQNLFNREPNVAPGNGAGGGNVLGRQWSVSGRIEF